MQKPSRQLPTSPEIRATVVRIFEETRKSKDAHYDPDRFLAFLTEPPARSGRRVADTFAGRRRFVRFIEAAQLEFGVCFSNEDWEHGFTLDAFTELVGRKVARRKDAHRLARKRMAEARALLVSEPLKFGMLTLFLPVVAVVSQNLAIRLLTSLLWVAILVSTFLVNANGYKYAKRLVEQTREEQ